jgi:mycothiol synthase
LLHLRHPRPAVRHLLARDADRLAGYAQLEDGERLSTGQLLVAPASRCRGIGRALLDRLLALAQHPLRIWAMGDTPAAAALARQAGLHPVRELSIMTRPLDDDLPEPRLPPGVTIRRFQPDADEETWLAVNARAFAHHPEQGRIDRADLAERMAEPWFDPAGLLVAADGDRLLGFHWTKRHSATLGEV